MHTFYNNIVFTLNTWSSIQAARCPPPLSTLRLVRTAAIAYTVSPSLFTFGKFNASFVFELVTRCRCTTRVSYKFCSSMSVIWPCEKIRIPELENFKKNGSNFCSEFVIVVIDFPLDDCFLFYNNDIRLKNVRKI